MSYWRKNWILGIICGSCLLAAIFWWGPAERKQWILALAHEARLNENYDLAVECFSRLIAEDPTDLDARLQRAATWIEAQETTPAAEALTAILDTHELSIPQRVEASRLLGLLQQHSAAYQQLQLAYQHMQEQIRQQETETNRPLDLSAQDKLLWANNLGYYAYLADVDLAERFQELDNQLSQNSVDDQVALYRAQALRVVGRSAEGRQIVESAARRLAQRLQQEEADLQDGVGRWLMTPDWPATGEPLTIRHRRSSVMEMRLMLRILWEHAAQLSADLQDEAQQREYLARAAATRISRDHVQFDLSPQMVAQQLVMFATYLDTRGSLASKLEKWPQAEADLDAAIQANYLAQAITWDVGLQNTPTLVDIRQLRQVEFQARRALAIYHYHRGQLRANRGDTAANQQDWQAVERLGFQPGPDLH
jgi:tetratricopeptide (TPR) repeat protein